MENYSGDIWYYWGYFNMYFGNFIWFLVLAGLIILLLIKKYQHKTTIAIVTYFLAAYIFFSFIAQTKILNYFTIVVPLGYILMAIAAYHLINIKILVNSPLVGNPNIISQLILNFQDNIKGIARYLYIPILILLTIVLFNIPEITAIHDPKNLGINNNFWQYQAHNNAIYKNLKNDIPAGTKVVFNMLSFNEVDVMFYNKGVAAYAWVPYERDFNKYIKAKNIPIAVFKAHNEYGVPDYIKNYPLTYIIDKEIK